MSKRLKYTVNVLEKPGHPFPIKSNQQSSRNYAIGKAKEFADAYPDKYVYIEFFRPEDNQHGYVNPDGSYSITGESWTNPSGE